LCASARLKNDYPQQHCEEAGPSLSKSDLPHGGHEYTFALPPLSPKKR
jgi:hypothetical protein